MHPRELRIGNMVLFNGQTRWVNHVLITEMVYNNQHGFEGMPIDDVLLYELGFRERKFTNGPYVFNYLENTLLVNDLPISCVYVHQLQNTFFAITGVELNK